MEAPDPNNVRILTTLGHVDHGKTTLMDALLAANNIISSRMAGKMRYLDSREDEQERGITMESSAVSLKFHVKGGEGQPNRTYIVNMIDTPGHVDFSSEVSIASRLCDGALVLVDVVEGVCTQTTAVLRQAWQDRLKPILVINKFDRLITELKLSPTEAHHHLTRLVEDVNAVMGSFFAADRMEDDLRWHEERKRRLQEKKDALAGETDAAVEGDEQDYRELEDEDIYFAPEKGNVVFASAIDGWGFRVSKFASLYAAKLGFSEAGLRRALWGDYYFDPKTKKAIGSKHLAGRPLKPIFVKFVLENIWAVYDAVVLNPDPEKTSRIVSALNLKILPRDLRSKDTRHLLSLIFTQWLPLSSCIIQAAIDVVPAPHNAQATRIPKMLYPDLREATIASKNKLEEDLYAARDDADAFVVAYVSKMFAVAESDLPENKKRPMTADEMRAKAREAREARQQQADQQQQQQEKQQANGTSPAPEGVDIPATPSETPDDAEKDTKIAAEAILGFARLYSGSLKVGVTVHCVLPKYNAALGPRHPANARYLSTTKVEGLYVMMGRELQAVDVVRAGNIFAIRGLEGKVLRSGTLCAAAGGSAILDDEAKMREYLINLGSVNRATPPIVRVALEPAMPADLQKLVHGLKLLNQADPCVETFQQHTGEHVILTAGELHLERCLKDLRERFAKVEIQASKPIVPFRETAVKAPDMAPPKTPNAPRGTIRGSSAHDVVTFTIRAAPLPKPILDFVQDNISVIKKMDFKAESAGGQQENGQSTAEADAELELDVEVDIQGEVARKATVRPEQFWDALKEVCAKVGGEWASMPERVWAFGPQRAGGCVLVDTRPDSKRSLKRRLDRGQSRGQDIDLSGEADKRIEALDNHIETGFQLATFQGPLCAEPVEGLAYFVENVEVDKEALEREIEQNRMAQLVGSVITGVRDACRNGLLDWSPRLLLAMYSCDIQCSTDVLGKVYGVVAKRRGRIVAEEMKEGTSFFTVTALIPVAESFGFADDIRKRTSGAASPQLIFSGYELLDQDPFWVPKTEEELEDLGEKADRSNIAKAYMDGVRDRKGMFVDRKIVEFAEKQRTLKR